MWKLLGWIGVVACCAGCATGPKTVELAHQAGSAPSARVAAIDACAIESFKEVPQAIVTESLRPYITPTRVYCDRSRGLSYCREFGGNAVPRYRSYDANGALRKRFIARCLEERGFTVVERRYCERGELSAYRADPQSGLNDFTCVGRDQTVERIVRKIDQK